ncbi:hypothetical protein BH20ACT9_BH20ACT9_07310 [soil metagenome]
MSATGVWALLVYSVPREPSTPRISVWRKLKRLGVAQLADSVVALPLDARNREQLEWIADEVREAGGEAALWLAEPTSVAQERELVRGLAGTRAEEYSAVAAEAHQAVDAAGPERRRVLVRLRRELRRIAKRDYFPPAEREHARQAVRHLADAAAAEEQRA